MKHSLSPLLLVASIGVLWGCADISEEVPAQAPCNGHSDLCDRGYDQVAYLTTHNAMSNEDEGWMGPNQLRSMDVQLEDGVRGFTLDTYLEDGEALLCHGICYLGSEPLTEALRRFTRFMEDNPREVITFILESHAPFEETAQSFEDSGLLSYVHVHTPGTPWPSLGELVERNERLVVFSDEGGSAPWNHPVWDHCWETHWHWEDPAEMNCDPNRGDPAHSLFILNHFITDPIASEEDATQVNQEDFLWERAKDCQEESGQIPNFVTVDFYSVGGAQNVVNRLNGLDTEDP